MANTEEKTSGNQRFYEQCYLVWNWSAFSAQNADVTYENMAIIQGEPTDVINKLVSNPGLDRLFQLKPYENSALMPLIKLFKTTYGDSEKTEEIKFASVTSQNSIDAIMSTRYGRGDGIGIKSVSYDLQGGSTTGGAALVKKGVTQVDISFFFQNLEMLVQREGNGPALIDLVTFPPKTSNIKAPGCAEGAPIDFTDVFDAGKFAIKLVYGYAVPDNELIDQELKEVIDRSRTTLLLNLQRHELDFKQDGTVELKCQYMGYTDSMMNRPEADIFYLGEERDKNINGKKEEIDSTTEQLNQAKKELEDAKKNNASEDDIDAIKKKAEELEDNKKDLEEEQKKQGDDDRIFVYQRLLQALYDSGKIKYVDLDENQVQAYFEELDSIKNKKSSDGKEVTAASEKEAKEKDKEEAKSSSGPVFPDPQKAAEDNDDLENLVEDVLDKDNDLDDLKSQLEDNVSDKGKDPGDVRVNYFYYGDLMDVAFSVLNKNPQASTLKPMLGPIPFNDPRSGQSTIVSLADIPISLNKFLEWFNANVVGKGRDSYMLEDFIRDTIKDLLHASLGENCFTGIDYPTPVPNVSVAAIPVAKGGNSESRIPMNSRINVDQIETNVPTHYQDANKIDQYIYIYAYTFGLSNLNGDRSADHKRGIYHMQVGADRGLVKKLSFSRIDDPKLAASRATSVQCDLRHLRENYKVTIDMIGNSLFSPGQTIYVNPTLAGGADPQLTATVADALGLGGYYTVHKVGGELSSDGFKTTIEAIWESPRKSKQAGIQKVVSNSPSVGGYADTGKDTKKNNIDSTPFTATGAARGTF